MNIHCIEDILESLISVKYKIYKKRLYFDWTFNDDIVYHINLINNNNLTGIVFSNYHLDDVKLMYTKNNIWMQKHNHEFKGSKFNYSVNWNYIPDKITYLSLGDDYNQSDKLPKNLKYLIFGFAFDKHIELPDKLIYLIFGQQFNCKITLPQSLKYLKFGKFFNQEIILPDSLEHLELGLFFDHSIELPDGLENLVFEENIKQLAVPKNIKQLVCSCTGIENKSQFFQQIGELKKITKLVIRGLYNQPDNIISIPFSLVNLECYCVNKILFGDNTKLSTITLGYNNIPDIQLVSSIRSITLMGNNKIIDWLPNNLEIIIILSNFNLPLPIDNLPNGIKKIIIRNNYYNLPYYVFNGSLDNLPESVEYIKLPSGYDKKINKFPKNLKKIVCSKEYKYIGDLDGYEVWRY